MADIRSLEMPKWGMTMEEGTIVQWNFSEGDSVSAGDALAEAESSKLSGELEAPISGVLARIIGKEGETYTVGQAVAVIADSSTTDAEIDAYLATLTSESAGASEAEQAKPAPVQEKKEVTAQKKDIPEHEKPSQHSTKSKVATNQPTGSDSIPASLKGDNDGAVAATPHAAALAAKHGIALSKVEASGRGGRVTVADLQKTVEQAGGRLTFGNTRERKPFAAVHGDDSKVKATVHARKLAEEEGVNLLGVRASGRDGRVTRNDVRAWIALNREPEKVPATSAAQAAASSDSTHAGNPSTDIPMSTMRKVIGSRLQESYLQSPHFRVSAEAQIDRLLAFRRVVNNNRLDVRLTVNDLVTTAVARALRTVPEVNAQFDPETEVITQFEHADIAIAVSTEEGLITPIVRRADQLSPSEISAQVTDLATRAKAGTLKPDEFQGGTFTISNLGMFGISNFDAIINPPQVAILAVGGAAKKFVPDAEGNPIAATILAFTLSADHRVVDGATSARFCKELKTLLETPALIFA